MPWALERLKCSIRSIRLSLSRRLGGIVSTGFTRATSICGKTAVLALVVPIVADSCACTASDHAAAMPPNRLMNSRLLVCRERSIVRGDEGRIMTRPSSRPEARSLLGYQTANELGAPVASSIPAQLLGHEPASARMGYEDGHALFLRY